jgi:hypothetical protein
MTESERSAGLSGISTGLRRVTGIALRGAAHTEARVCNDSELLESDEESCTTGRPRSERLRIRERQAARGENIDSGQPLR